MNYKSFEGRALRHNGEAAQALSAGPGVIGKQSFLIYEQRKSRNISNNNYTFFWNITQAPGLTPAGPGITGELDIRWNYWQEESILFQGNGETSNISNANYHNFAFFATLRVRTNKR